MSSLVKRIVFAESEQELDVLEQEIDNVFAQARRGDISTEELIEALGFDAIDDETMVQIRSMSDDLRRIRIPERA
jgi:hypothetical protein